MSTANSQLGVAAETAAAPTISSTSYAAGPPPTLSITFATAHGLVAHESWVTLAGFTPTSYNGLRVPVIAVGSATVATVLLPSALGAPTFDGTATKQTPGVAAAVDRFYIPNKIGIVTKPERITSEGIRRGTRTRSKSDVVPVQGIPKGPLSFEVRNKGFGFWWARIMGGAVATTSLGGSPAAYLHEWELGSLNGDTFTAQGNRPFRTGIDRPVNWLGCKINKATVAMKRNGMLMLDVDVIALTEDDTIALAAASYVANAEPASFCGAALSIDDVAVPALEWEFTVENSLESDTRRLRQNCAPMEPLHDGDVEVTWKATVDWRDYTFRNKYMSLAGSTGITGALVMSARWPVAISGSNFPELIATMPAAEFDGGDPSVDGIELLTQTIEGVALDPETGSGATALKVGYRTSDATP